MFIQSIEENKSKLRLFFYDIINLRGNYVC